MELENKHFLLAAASILSVSLILLLTVGIEQDSSQYKCQKTVKKCHGIPVGQNCLGSEKYTERIVEEEKCESVEEIERRCNSLGREICSLNNQSIGTRWADKSLVNGQKCSTWSREYSLNLTSC